MVDLGVDGMVDFIYMLNAQEGIFTIIGVQRRVKLRTSSFLCGGDPPTPPKSKATTFHLTLAPFRNVTKSSFF